VARWQKAPRRKRRLRGFPRLLSLILVLGGLGVAKWWWLQRQPLTFGPRTAAANATEATSPLVTPEFYGTPSALVPIGQGVSARLVDRPDSTAPLALILASPDDLSESWAGVQSLLEQFGVGSLVVTANLEEPTVRAAADLLLERARKRSQPIAIVVAGGALPLALSLGTESSLGDRSLVVLAPPPGTRSTLDALLAHAPRWLQHRLNGVSDSRLAAWRGPTLIVRARDDTRFDAVAANAMAAGGQQARVLVVPGSGFGHPTLHPDQESWRAIADFVRGVIRAREEITVEPDSLLPIAPTLPPPADNPPPQPR